MKKAFDSLMKIPFESFVILAILGAALWAGLRTTSGSTVLIGGFHVKHEADLPKVAADLESYVLSHGFSRDPTSGGMASGGLRSVGEKISWFRGNTESTGNVWVQLGTREGVVDTAVAWQVEGFRYQIRQAEIRAMQVMVDIARWREARPEEQSWPKDDREERLKRLESELAASYR